MAPAPTVMAPPGAKVPDTYDSAEPPVQPLLYAVAASSPMSTLLPAPLSERVPLPQPEE